MIVRSINACENAKQIWCEIYENLILPCVKLIQEQAFEEAYQLYKSTTLQLEKRYIKKL